MWLEFTILELLLTVAKSILPLLSLIKFSEKREFLGELCLQSEIYYSEIDALYRKDE